jgi:outer membrane protein OmpU
MKKSLLATTALAALGAVAVASPASAKFEVGVSGYMEQWFGYSDNKESSNPNSDSFDQVSDVEFNIDFKQTLDNGIEIGGQIQVEGQQAGGEADEQYIFINGSFGRLEIGTDNGAAYRMHYGVASNGIGIDEGDWATVWIPGTDAESRATSIGSGIENDQNKITYFSPRVSGVQIGATYIPEMDVNLQVPQGGGREADAVRDNAYSIAANYQTSVDAISIMASIGYTNAGDGVGSNHDGINAGLRIGFGGFTASLAYGEEDDDSANDDEVSILGFGLGYTAGPAGVSIAYLRGEDSADNFKQNALEVGASYAVGPGVTAKGSVYYADSKTNGNNTGNGVAVVGGLALSF